MGDRLKEQGDLEGALREYSNALEVDPSYQPARAGLTAIRSLMGDRYAEAAASFDDMVQRQIVQRAQARMAAEDAAVQGDLAYRQGDMERAIEHYRQAQMILRYNPLIATESFDEALITGKLRNAIQKQEESALLKERQAQELAEIARREAELKASQYRESKLRTLYMQANTAFLSEKYSLAESLCAQILVEDPGNEAARELARIARDARHQKAEETNRADYREQWQRTFMDIETMNVIQLDTLEFNDPKRWAEVSQRQPLEFGVTDAVAAGDKAAILERLDQARAAARFLGPDGNGSSLADVANYLQQASGVNFVISSKVATELDEEQRTVKLDVPSERSVRKILELMAEVSENIRWKVEDGGGQVRPQGRAQGRPGAALLRGARPDPPGARLPGARDERGALGRRAAGRRGEGRARVERRHLRGARPAHPQQRRAGLVGSRPAEQPAHHRARHDGRAPDARGAGADPAPARRPARGDRHHGRHPGALLEGRGQLPRGHRRRLPRPGPARPGHERELQRLRRPSTQIDLGREIGQSTDLGAFYNRGFPGDMRARVEELYDIGLGDDNVIKNSGGLSFQWTYLNDLQLQLILRAVSKSERVELVTSPNITVYNTARGNLSVLNQVAYVQDFNVEIAQAASIADPIVNVVQDGVTLDVRPVVSADRRFITLELRPTIAVLRRPIREVVTTLGSQNSVTIQLPEVDYQRVRTSIPMPDGGTVLLGGMKVSDRQDQHSGVPILNKIPLVSFFFDRKGNYISNRKLLILLKASIVIPSEHEPTPAQVSPASKASRL
jgi:tetratricopeptide (TPR) repeat protein